MRIPLYLLTVFIQTLAFIPPTLVKVFIPKVNTKIKLCEYNIDCELPKICCRSFLIDQCCVPNKLILAPVPVYKTIQNKGLYLIIDE